jgi:SpoVK/Ycf46/Vps4 family AAA+-type ATPase
MKAQLLTELERIDSPSDTGAVFVLAATNFRWDLDVALLRRFLKKRIYIPLPENETQIAIMKMNINEMMDTDFDMEL